MEMIRWRLYEPSPLRDMLELLMQQEGGQWREGMRGTPMPINVHQTESEVVVQAALPGVRSEDLELNSQEGMLSIRAHFKVEPQEYLHQEIRDVEYFRQVALTVDCRFEAAEADFENGILTVRVPKRQPKVPEKIRIRVNRAGGSSTTIDAGRADYLEVEPKKEKPPRKKS